MINDNNYNRKVFLILVMTISYAVSKMSGIEYIYDILNIVTRFL